MAKNADNERLRQEKKMWRSALSSEIVGKMSEKISVRVLQLLLNRWKEYDDILCYAALEKEVSLERCYKELLSEGKRLYFPKVFSEQMDFFRVENLKKDLFAGKFGILEPAPNHIFERKSPGIILVPGIVFDERGNRIGFGKGYYDRYLSGCKKAVRVGICYEGQREKYLQPAQWDVPMDAVVTEEGYYIYERSQPWN